MSTMHHLIKMPNCNNIKFAKPNNSYSGFCELTPKHIILRSLWMTSDTKTGWN